MDAKEAIRKAIEAYMALVDFNLLVPGQERVLLCSGARTQLEAAQVPADQIEKLSWQIADFVPIAFGRIKPRANVLQYGQELATTGARELEILAKLSPEWTMLDWAIRSGKKPENLDTSPPILNGPDELCDPLERQPRATMVDGFVEVEEAWWRFW